MIRIVQLLILNQIRIFAGLTWGGGGDRARQLERKVARVRPYGHIGATFPLFLAPFCILDIRDSVVFFLKGGGEEGKLEQE